jgi:hypothetical protein
MYRSESPEGAAPSGPAPIVMEGIVRLRCVEARYNGGHVVLAPHVFFIKNDAPHVGAITIERDGKPPREAKIGIFKLDGLGDLRLSDRSFAPSPAFEPEDLRFVDTKLLTVELAKAA